MVMNNIDQKYELLQHLNRVSELSYSMAVHMKLDETTCKEIAIAGHLHDVGKLLIHPAILNKAGKISSEEKMYLQEHVKYSYMIGLFIGERLTEDILKMIYQHHENNDGTGYPNEMKGKDMHIGSHIIRICDVYDALRSVRPYRACLSKEEAFEVIMNEKEKYKPECIEALKDIERIKGKEILFASIQNNKNIV